MKKKIYFHIGYPKNGSTFLQEKFLNLKNCLSKKILVTYQTT